MSSTIIPAGYKPALSLYDTQRAIGTIKQVFAETLCATLNLRRVSAPLFVETGSGLNDDLNGVEDAVERRISSQINTYQDYGPEQIKGRMSLFETDMVSHERIYQYVRHTVTSDNGKEFANHKAIAEALGVDFHFANPYHS